MKYIVITPVKNEEKYISFLVSSMLMQSVRPEKWIIVDDGSTDSTIEVVKQYVSCNEWIRLERLETKQEKKSYGSKVIRAFNFGLAQIDITDYDFLVKLDADLSLPPDYFLNIIEAFKSNPKLGICGGYIVENETDLEKKQKSDYFVQGALKSIRKECFKDIGGFWEINGWDGLDQHLARYNGWEIKNIDIPVHHHRPRAQDYVSNAYHFHNGVTSYKLGNNLFLTLVRLPTRIVEKPYFLGAISFLLGYIKGLIWDKRIIDAQLASFIRNYHYNRILRRLH